MKHNELSRKQ
jgi:hypothetical protein